MKKYKHKKTGDIAEYIISSYKILNSSQAFLIPEMVENTSDWVEIKEESWQILEFKSSKDGSIFYIADNGNYATAPNKESDLVSLITLLKDSYWLINSIKRLSDNQIINIGDYIRVESSHQTEVEKVTKITINEHNNAIIWCSSFHKNGVNIDKVKVVEKPNPVLFVTEDGVGIGADDRYWVSDMYCGTPIHCTGYQYSFKDKHVKRFSTKEKCEQWIIEYKPLFSIADLKRIQKESGYDAGIDGEKEYWVCTKILEKEAKKKLDL